MFSVHLTRRISDPLDDDRRSAAIRRISLLLLSAHSITRRLAYIKPAHAIASLTTVIWVKIN